MSFQKIKEIKVSKAGGAGGQSVTIPAWICRSLTLTRGEKLSLLVDFDTQEIKITKVAPARS